MMKKLFCLIAVFGLIVPASFSAPVRIELPLETAVYKAAPGADFANAQCLTCHSADYVSTQPVMPRAFWKGSVEKMIAKYGAPIPPEQVDALADYLAKNYGTDSSNSSTVAIVVPKNTSAKQLLLSTGCINCHSANQKIIGPSFQSIAEKYKNDPEGRSRVSHQIANGGSGLWGAIPMPPFKQLSTSDIDLLVDWVLNQK